MGRDALAKSSCEPTLPFEKPRIGNIFYRRIGSQRKIALKSLLDCARKGEGACRRERERMAKKKREEQKEGRKREKKRKIAEAKHRVPRRWIGGPFSLFEIVMTVEYGQEYQRNLVQYSSEGGSGIEPECCNSCDDRYALLHSSGAPTNSVNPRLVQSPGLL